MLHVINEVTIDTCDIHQIKENAEVKSNRWLLIQTICGSILVHKINSTHSTIVKLANFKRRNRRLGLLTLFSLLNWWYVIHFFKNRWLKQHWPIIHLFASHCMTWRKELAISPFYLLIVNHFWHLLSVGSNCSNTINAFLE